MFCNAKVGEYERRVVGLGKVEEVLGLEICRLESAAILEQVQ
jgi:hypothetical protein